MCIGSCLAGACASCCCSAMGRCGAKRGVGSRIPYMVLMFISCMFAVIMALYGESRIKTLAGNMKTCNSEQCEGNGTVYRVSFVLFIFFLIHVIMVKIWMAFHWKWFPVKVFLFLAVLITLFFLKDTGTFFGGYAEFARIASVIFLIIQVMLVILWAADWNDEMVLHIQEHDPANKKVDPDDLNAVEEEELSEDERKAKCYKVIIFGGWILCSLVSIVVWILCFIWFGNEGPGCEGNETVIAMTIVIVVVLNIVTAYMPNASPFTTSMVSLYVTYLLYTALAATTDGECNTFAANQDDVAMWMGILVTAGAISYMGMSVSRRAGLMFDPRQSEDVDAPVEDETSEKTKSEADLEAAEDDDAADDGGKSNYDDVDDDKKSKKAEKKKEKKGDKKYTDEENALEAKANFVFHLCMCFASIYISMLYTGWATDTANSDTARGRSHASFAVNVAAQYLTFLLYMWVLMAPKCCPGRFAQEEDDDDY